MKDDDNLALLDAIDTLTSISDLDLEEGDGIIDKDQFVVQDRKLYYRTFNWQGIGDDTIPSDLVKKTFGVILKYLKRYCQKSRGSVTDKESIEKIKSIMMLVGESARKLDRYTNLFYDTKAKRASGLKEYKKLQELYVTRIARSVDASTLGQWILGLARKEISEEPKSLESIKHLFVDLESLKKDEDYELLFMKKEDGSRFFNSRLIRNMKLICDFGEFLVKDKLLKQDPFVDLEIWYDRSVQVFAKKMLQLIEPHMKWFYKTASHCRERDVISLLNSGLMALMMSGNPRNLLENEPVKSCFGYFSDFLFFLEDLMISREYQKMLVYPKNKAHQVSKGLLNVIHSLCQALYQAALEYRDVLAILNQLVDVKFDSKISLSDLLSNSYKQLQELIKRYPNGPLKRNIDVFERGDWSVYDPLHQGNYPQLFGSLRINENKTDLLRLPTPTWQEHINEAFVSNLFKGFLFSDSKRKNRQKFLVINLQDRSSWAESARCKVLEELQYNRYFENSFTLITLDRQSEFYEQSGPFSKDNHAKKWIKKFIENLLDKEGGYFFPKSVKKVIFPKFAEELIYAIHKVFFFNKNVLSKDQRRDFIDIFHVFLELKLIEVVKPSICGFTCKDGVDVSSTASIALIAFLLLVSKEEIEEQDFELLKFNLLIPALFVRGRVIHAEQIHRLLSVLQVIEYKRFENGFENFSKTIKEVFAPFFGDGIFENKIIKDV